MMLAAFSTEPGTSRPEVYDVAGRYVLIQVLERSEPDAETLAEARESRREQALIQKQNEVIDQWLGDYRKQLESSGRLRINAELALGQS